MERLERLERLERSESLDKLQHSGYRLSIRDDVFGSFLLLTLVSREVGLNLWPEVTYRRGATIPAAQIHAA